MDNQNIKTIFCAKCQTDTPHKAAVDMNGDFLFACQNEVDGVACDRFIKLPADHPVEEFAAFFAAHKEANQGQVSLEAQEKKLAEVLAGLPGDVVVTSEQTEEPTEPTEPEIPIEPEAPVEPTE